MIGARLTSATFLLGGLVAGSADVVRAERISDGVSLINVAAAETHAPQAEAPAEAEKPAVATDDGTPAPAPLWPEMPAVEAAKQPYILIRSLRAVQDQIAAGSASAHELQRQLMQDLGVQMAAMPAAVWDDVRNVRAAVFFVLSGGNPAVLRAMSERKKIPQVERRAIRGALAYGEGRLMDATGLLQKLDARTLDPPLRGIVALIQGTLISKKNPVKAIALFDDARLIAPGTLIEESALRQQILLLAREGELERFDILTEQYSRRFPKSLFARSFRRQFFAGVARQNFKRASEWISRTETELMKVPAAERVGLYLAIAEEATKGGNIDIARFAAVKARELSRADSRTFQRAKLFEGAALAATDEFEQGLALLNSIDLSKIDASDRDIRDSALKVANAVGRWPGATETVDKAEPASVGRAQAVLVRVDALLEGTSP